MSKYRYVTLERDPKQQYFTISVVREPYVEYEYGTRTLSKALKTYLRNWVWVINRNIKQDY
jgi:hypothetical protein